MKFCFTILLYISIFSVCFAQKIVKVCGEYTYYYPSNISRDQAMQIAIDRARTEALIKEFNQIVYQSNTTVISNKNGESSSDFYSYGGNEVQGEWIEDIEEPKITFSVENNELFLCKAEVCGTARKRVNGTEFISKILRNGTEDKFESDTFKEDDYLYLSFIAPIDGYLCVYLLDRDSKQVFCLLPYNNSPDGTVKIKGDKQYLFFNPYDKNQPDYKYIEGNFYITCNKEVEYNEIYVIFSPNNFSKANGSKITKEDLPKELPFKEFQKWLVSNQTKDKDMKVNKHLIKIDNQHLNNKQK